MKYPALVFTCFAFVLVLANEPAAAPVAAAEAAPAAPKFLDPGLDLLSDKDREQYLEALKVVMQKPEVQAARQAAVKAQDDMLKASARMRELRDAALVTASAELADIVKKVEVGRQQWAERQRMHLLTQRMPQTKVAAPILSGPAPDSVPGIMGRPTVAMPVPASGASPASPSAQAGTVQNLNPGKPPAGAAVPPAPAK